MLPSETLCHTFIWYTSSTAKSNGPNSCLIYTGAHPSKLKAMKAVPQDIIKRRFGLKRFSRREKIAEFLFLTVALLSIKNRKISACTSLDCNLPRKDYKFN